MGRRERLSQPLGNASAERRCMTHRHHDLVSSKEPRQAAILGGVSFADRHAGMALSPPVISTYPPVLRRCSLSSG